jgi:DNA repair exonuclease SbcCD ATPase subunit
MLSIASLLQVTAVATSGASSGVTSITFTQLVATVSIVVGLFSVGSMLYKMGAHSADLKNTKEKLSAEMKGLSQKVDEGFAKLDQRLDRTEATVTRRDDDNIARRAEWSIWREQSDAQQKAKDTRIDNVEEKVAAIQDVIRLRKLDQ